MNRCIATQVSQLSTRSAAMFHLLDHSTFKATVACGGGALLAPYDHVTLGCLDDGLDTKSACSISPFAHSS